MRFSVTMGARAARDVEIEADSPEEALEKVKAQSLTETVSLEAEALEVIDVCDSDGEVLVPKDSDDYWEVVGGCEACSDPILRKNGEPGDYGYNAEDGIYICRECLNSQLSDAAAKDLAAEGDGGP